MRILITRPEPEATAFAQTLEPLGFSCVIDPLLEVTYLPLSQGMPMEAIPILTSKQAVPALEAFPYKDRPILTVGTQTAKAVSDLGFTSVRAAGGNVQALFQLICSEFPKGQPFFYLSGRQISFDLSQALTHRGYRCHPAVVYETRFKSFSPLTIASLKNGQIQGIVFMSLNTVKAFVESWWGAGGSSAMLKDVCAFALSPVIADALEHQPWACIETAPHPTAAHLINLMVAVKEITDGQAK